MFNCPPSNTCMCKCVEWFCNEKIVKVFALVCKIQRDTYTFCCMAKTGKTKNHECMYSKISLKIVIRKSYAYCWIPFYLKTISNVPINKILLRKAYCNNKPCLWYWIQWLCGSHRYDTNLVHVFVENKAAILGKFMPLPTLLCTVIYKSFCHLQCPWKQLFQ